MAKKDKLIKRKDKKIAFGEVTGHSHQIVEGECEIWSEEGEVPASEFTAITPCTLGHEEHGPIVIEPGCYDINIQKEVDPFEDEIRRVRD